MTVEVGKRFATARGAWLRASQKVLEDDERVAAVLLTGSIGRGTADDWSDVDVAVALATDAAASLVDDCHAFVEGFGDAVFVFDSPWNAPYDGAQVNALYDLGCG